MMENVQTDWVPQIIKLCKQFLMMDLILLFSPEGTMVRRLYIIRLQTVAVQWIEDTRHRQTFTRI